MAGKNGESPAALVRDYEIDVTVAVDIGGGNTLRPNGMSRKGRTSGEPADAAPDQHLNDVAVPAGDDQIDATIFGDICGDDAARSARGRDVRPHEAAAAGAA